MDPERAASIEDAFTGLGGISYARIQESGVVEGVDLASYPAIKLRSDYTGREFYIILARHLCDSGSPEQILDKYSSVVDWHHYQAA